MSIDIRKAVETMLELGIMPFTLTLGEEKLAIEHAADIVVSNLDTEHIVPFTQHFLAYAKAVQPENFECALERVGEVFLVDGMADLMFSLPEWNEWAKEAWKMDKDLVTV